MKPSKTFHQTSTPLSRLWVDPSPPSFKQISVIKRRGKKKVSKHSYQNIFGLERCSGISSHSSSINVLENGVSDSKQEAGSFSNLFSKTVCTKAGTLHSGLLGSVPKERNRISDTFMLHAKNIHQDDSPETNCLEENHDFNSSMESLTVGIKSATLIWGEISVQGLNAMSGTEKLGTDDLLNSATKSVSKKNVTFRAKKVHRENKRPKLIDTLKVKEFVKSRKNIDATIKRDYLVGKGGSRTFRNSLINTKEINSNEHREISTCTVKSKESVKELVQVTLIRRKSKKLKKKLNKENNKHARKITNEIPSKNPNVNLSPFILSCKKEQQVKGARKDNRQEMSLTKCNVESPMLSTGQNEKISIQKEFVDFIKEFHAGLDFHSRKLEKTNSITKLQKRDIEPEVVSAASSGNLCENMSSDKIVVNQTVAEIASLKQSAVINNDLTAIGDEDIYNPSTENSIDQNYCFAPQPSLKEDDLSNLLSKFSNRDPFLEADEISQIDRSQTNFDTVTNPKKIGVLKEAFKQPIAVRKFKKKLTKIPSKVNKTEAGSGQLKDPSAATKELLDETFSYPSTSTPFDSPEPQSRRMPSMVQNLSPVIEEQPRIPSDSISEPSLIFADKKYGKQQSLSKSNTTSREDQLWLSMTRSLSMTTLFQTSNSNMGESSTDLSRKKEGKAGESKDVEDIVLFETPPRDLTVDISDRDGNKRTSKMRTLKKKITSVDTTTHKRKNKRCVKITSNKDSDSKGWDKVSCISEQLEDISNWSLSIENVK